MANKLYPVGIQNFEIIRKEDYLYVDKTAYVYHLTHDNGKSFFLGRPRRFGKSLLVSTLHSYFSGRKDLFKGLAIEKMEADWKAYPVLHFDMSMGKHMDKEGLEKYLEFILEEEEKKYGIEPSLIDVNLRLVRLIKTACRKTGQPVVVLIDEYDAPLLDVVHENENLENLRRLMRNFFSPLKACDPYLRFVFMTGITKFSQMSIFSELNNITNISMVPQYAGICGITKEEIEQQMSESVDEMACKLKLSHEEMLEALRDHYDGYHFAWPSPDVFNPYSLLNAFAKGRMDYFWFDSGTPTYLLKMLEKFGVKPSDLKAVEAEAYEFDTPTETMTSIVPLLYQSGYLTIKDYHEDFKYYTLDIPNREVRVGLMRSLIPNYVSSDTLSTTNMARRLAFCLMKDDMDGALRLLQTFLGTVPYCSNTNYEGHYQQLFFVVFSLLTDFLVDVEVHTPNGRVDIVLMTKTRLFLIELKLNRNAAAALSQINLKDYRQRFALSKLPVTKVGVNFDGEKNNISDWLIE
mgnify:FL=1